MRYRLRTLLIVLALAPPVLAGLCLWCLSAGSTLDAAFRAGSLCFAFAIASFVVWLHWMAATELSRQFRERPKLPTAELSYAFGARIGNEGESRILEDLRLIGEALGVDSLQLRSDDTMDDLLRPSPLAEHFRGECLEVLLIKTYGWNAKDRAPLTLGELVSRLRSRSG
jgi:hypothetical protein